MINDQTHKTQNWNFEYSLCIEEPQKNRFKDSGYFHSHFEDPMSVYNITFWNMVPIFILTEHSIPTLHQYIYALRIPLNAHSVVIMAIYEKK